MARQDNRKFENTGVIVSSENWQYRLSGALTWTVILLLWASVSTYENLTSNLCFVQNFLASLSQTRTLAQFFLSIYIYIYFFFVHNTIYLSQRWHFLIQVQLKWCHFFHHLFSTYFSAVASTKEAGKSKYWFFFQPPL